MYSFQLGVTVVCDVSSTWNYLVAMWCLNKLLLLQLSDEIKHYKEMCANYEQQLQRTQRQMTQEMAEKEEAMETIMDTVEKHRVNKRKPVR